jgi:hypothetical protein
VIEDVVVACPYCGESFGTLVDGSGALEGDAISDYFEDCAVCCRPIRFLATFDAGGALEGLEVLTDAD